MKNLLKTTWKKIGFEQKKEWDKIAFFFLKECDFIIDVGCGEGRFISQDSSKITGVDINDKSLQECKKKGYKIIKSDIRNLPFEDESIPGIHCSHVIEHFLPCDVYKILSEFNRILMPGGIMVIRSPVLSNEFYSDLTHIRPYNPKVIIKYLTPSKQRTLEHISESFKVIYLKWRYKSFQVKNKYFDTFFNILRRWGFPWLKKDGYMLVMKKEIFNELYNPPPE